MSRFFYVISIISIVCFLATSLIGCSYISDDELYQVQVAGAFVEAINEQRYQDALSLLAPQTQSRIQAEDLARTPSDFRAVLDAMRNANIIVSDGSDRHEIGMHVPKLDGREGVVRFVLEKIDSVWRIVYIYQE